jgi:serine/threonine protein kinase
MLNREDVIISAPPMSVKEADLVGKIFAQKFEITSFLGRGGMSDVYKARHLVTGKIVAVKVLHEKHAQDSVTIKRLKQEAQAAGALAHSNILGVHDLDVDESGTPFLVMDFIDGVSLSEFLRANHPIKIEQFLSIMAQVAFACSHAQQKGVVHRDLKPSNIMIIQNGDVLEVKIVDFGIAKLLGEDPANAQRLTQTGETFGSPAYMSPEQCLGQVLDSRSDIYSFGIVMYEALSGGPPHIGESVFDTVHRHVNAAPPPLVAPQLDESVRSRMEGIILRCLAKEPGSRYQTFDEVRSDLRKLDAATGGTVLAQLEQAWNLVQAKHAARRKTKVPLLVCTLFLMAVLSIGSSAWLVVIGFDVDHAFRTLHKTSRARVKYLQAYVDSTLIYKFGQAYLRSRKSADLDAMDAIAGHCQKTLQDAAEILKDEPVARERYERMGELLVTGITGFREVARSLPKSEHVNLFSQAPKLRAIVQSTTSAQREVIAIQDQEDVELNKLSERVQDLQRQLILIGLITLLLNGAIVVTLIIYFVKQKAQSKKEKASIMSDVSGKT